LIHIWKVKRNPLFERKVIDLPWQSSWRYILATWLV
jgi:hypothetical protein